VDQIVSVDAGRVTIGATTPAGERTLPIQPSISSSIP
jgi:hypothetical protein